MPVNSNFTTDDAQWFTNFYYEEELRSVLMNGAFNSGFKPGIYNGKIAIYASPGTGTSDNAGGLYLYIGKGTTFVFSNRFNITDGRYHLDYNVPGSFIIKSTAANDLTLSLIELGQSRTQGSEYVLGNVTSTTNIPPMPKFYVMARIIYDEDSADDNTEGAHPEIMICFDNTNEMSSDPDWAGTWSGSVYDSADPTTDQGNYYYSLIYNDGDTYWLPDGSTNYARYTATGTDFTEIRKRIAYLPIGLVTDPSERDVAAASRRIYLNGNLWNDENHMGATTWTKNHVFIGRGWPSYRNNYICNKNNYSPELIPSWKCNALYLDVNNIFDGDILYNTEIESGDASSHSFEGPFGIGDLGVNFTESSDLTKAFKLDYELESPTSGTVSDDWFCSGYSSEITNVVDEVNQLITDTTSSTESVSDHPLLNSDYILISDIIFLTTRKEYSNTDMKTLSNIFNTDSTAETNLKIVPFRWYSAIDSSDETFKLFNPSANDDESTLESRGEGKRTPSDGSTTQENNKWQQAASTDDEDTATIALDGYDQSTYRMIPLDVCENNTARLYKIIQNRNIIPNVVDYLRQNPLKSPYLNPIEATSLIPAAIIFRKCLVTKSGTTITELTPVDYISELGDGTTEGTFHPANVLSFFDLEYKTLKLNPVNFKSDGVYKVLPVIN